MARRASGARPSQALLTRLRHVAEAVKEPLLQAQERCFEAMEAGTAARRLALAADALEITPVAADAWAVLAREAPEGSALSLELWRQAVAAGMIAVGPATFLEEAGVFWGILETRPFMRAREGLAQELWRHGRREEAIAELRDMLRLNPNDNQGVRYLLMDWLLAGGRDEEAQALHDAYAEDGYAGWLYAAALLAFRRHGEGDEADAALARAIAGNPHLAGLLTGEVPMPRSLPDAYTWGSKEEASIVAAEARAAWDATPAALEWLRRRTPRKPPGRARAGA